MPEVLEILGLIPARGGSKGLPRKNLAPLAGKPLIAHTIESALAAKLLSRVIVSTDDESIAAVAREFGAETPFLRPDELAADASPAIVVIQHALEWLNGEEGWQADAVVYLQPTSPMRRAEHIDEAVEIFLREKADSLVSVMEVPHNMNPVSLMRLEHGGLVPLSMGSDPMRRQDKPKLYARNGPAILIVSDECIRRHGMLYGPKTLPYLMNRVDSLDIDTEFDLQMAEWIFREGHASAARQSD